MSLAPAPVTQPAAPSDDAHVDQMLADASAKFGESLIAQIYQAAYTAGWSACAALQP